MNVFTSPYCNPLYLRVPDGGGADLKALTRARDNGFTVVLLTMQDEIKVDDKTYPAWSFDGWDARRVPEYCQKIGLLWAPWAFLDNNDEAWMLRGLALEAGRRQALDKGLGCWNVEAPLETGEVTIEAINASSAGCDMMVSTLPWQHATTAPKWSALRRDAVVELQLFPSRPDALPGTPSREPRDCRAQGYSVGMPRVRWQHGLRDIGSPPAPPEMFPFPGKGVFSLYTNDDCLGVSDLWAPRTLQTKIPLSKMPSLYGPSSSRGPSQGKLVIEVKKALHRAGFGNFSKPDSVFNRRLEQAVFNMQRFYGMRATKAVGPLTWARLSVLPSAIPGPLEGPGCWALDNAKVISLV